MARLAGRYRIHADIDAVWTRMIQLRSVRDLWRMLSARDAHPLEALDHASLRAMEGADFQSVSWSAVPDGERTIFEWRVELGV